MAGLAVLVCCRLPRHRRRHRGRAEGPRARRAAVQPDRRARGRGAGVPVRTSAGASWPRRVRRPRAVERRGRLGVRRAHEPSRSDGRAAAAARRVAAGDRRARRRGDLDGHRRAADPDGQRPGRAAGTGLHSASTSAPWSAGPASAVRPGRRCGCRSSRRADGRTSRAVPVAHLGELLGLIVVRASGRRRSVHRRRRARARRARPPARARAAQRPARLGAAGVARRAAERNEELQASRLRIVTAADESRRAIERNLHDGAQQHLVALAVKLGLARQLPRTATPNRC